MNIDISQYLNKLSERKVDTMPFGFLRPPINRCEEIYFPYMRYIIWDNNSLAEDKRKLGRNMQACYQRKTEADFIKLLEWIKKKDLEGKPLSPSQACGALNNTKKPSWVK